MKDRYFKYLAAAILAGVVLAIFSPARAEKQTAAPSNPSVLPASH